VEHADLDGPLDGRSNNERRLACHLQEIWDLGGGSPDPDALFGSLDAKSDESIDRYAPALDYLSLGVAAAPAARAQSSLQSFADSLFSCLVFEDGGAILDEGNCFRVQVSGGTTTQDPNDGSTGFDRHGFTYQVGAQNGLAPGWFPGISAGYRQDGYDSDDDRSQSDGYTALAG
jgi:hypothetical protein